MENTAENLDVTQVSDEQVDKYFETGGQAEPETPQVEVSAPETEVAEASTDERIEQSQKANDKVVPYGALHEERERRKELSRELNDIRERNAKMEERFQQFQQRLTQPQVQEPSFDDDPIGALKAEQERLRDNIQYFNQTAAQQQQQQQHQQQINQLTSMYQQNLAVYAKENPDFVAAYQDVSKKQFEGYVAAGFSVEEADKLAKEDELGLAMKAYRDGVNPAERVYQFAKARGYAAKAATPTVNNQQKLETIEKGMQAGKSLSSATGKGADPLSLEALAEMDDADLEKNWDKIMRQMGGR